MSSHQLQSRKSFRKLATQGLLSICGLASLLLLQSCSTIYFVSDDKSDFTTYSEWHSNFVFGLAETSSPVDMAQRCNGAQWQTIKTEQSFLQGLVDGLTSSIYNPHGVYYSCKSR